MAVPASTSSPATGRLEPLTVVVDVKTTGRGHFARPSREDGVIEVGLAYRSCTGDIETWGEYCNPGRVYLRPGWADESLARCGLKSSQIQDAETAEVVARQFRHWLSEIEKKESRKVQIRAFEREFDEWFLSKPPWSVSPHSWGPSILSDAREILKLSATSKTDLSSVMARLHLLWPPGPTNTATNDAHAALLVWEALRDRRSGPRG